MRSNRRVWCCAASSGGRPPAAIEFCERGLLARIHRYTLNRLRAEIEPVSPADFMRFLFEWQHVAPAHHLSGSDGVLHAVQRLDGFELAAGAWERHILPARVDRYDPSRLDLLCLTGQVGWARLSDSEHLALQPSDAGRACSCASTARRGSSWRRWTAIERVSLPLSLPARAMLDALAGTRRARSRTSSPRAVRSNATLRSRRSASSSPPGWSRRTGSPACAR